MRLEDAHDAVGEVAVEGEVGGADDGAGPLQTLAALEVGLAHGDADLFGLGAAGDDTAVVVAQDDEGAAPPIGAKDLLAAGKEVVAVKEQEHGGRWGNGTEATGRIANRG